MTSSRPLPPEDPALLERDNRLESLKAVVARLAHDFNNLLVPLFGYVAMIKEDLDPAKPSMRYAETMEKSATRAEQHLETILLATRPHRRFSPSSTDLAALLHRSLDSWEADLPSNGGIRVRRVIASCRLWADAAQWSTLFDQLLSNARFALATGGVVDVELAPGVISEAEAARLGIEPGDAWIIQFKDDGFGMAPETLHRACEPFFTTRSAARQPGLGLTSVHSITRQHGGQLLIDSAPNEGASVRIIVPARATPPPLPDAPAAAKPAPAKPLVTKADRILIVEDDALVREVMKTALETLGGTLHVAEDGEQGLAIFKRHRDQWRLVVSDLVMPRRNGLEMYKDIREIDPAVKVLLVSGEPPPGWERTFPPDAPNRPAFLKKPFAMKAFLEQVRHLLA